MRIAIVGTVASSILGFRKGLINLMISHNHKVYAFYCDGDEIQEEEIKKLGCVPIKYKMNRSGINILKDLLSIVELKRYFKLYEINVVFSYFTKPVLYSGFAANKAKVKRNVGMVEGLGYTFTDIPEGDSVKKKILKKILIYLYSLVIEKLDLLIFLNKDDPDDLINEYGLNIGEYKVLGGVGLDIYKYYQGNPDIVKIKFLFIGRLLSEKGIREYIHAAKLLVKKYSNVEFITLGSIDEDNPGSLTKNELKKLMDDGVITYPGYVENVEEWIRNSSVFVLPSYYREGVPRSTQEAMSCGLPVVTTNVPGCKETVINGLNGFLIPKWNTDALVESLEYFILNPNEITKMGKESRKIAENKYDENIVNRRLYKMIIGA